MTEVRFDISNDDAALCDKVLDRASSLDLFNRSYSRIDATMDIIAVHMNGTSLDFNKLLGFDNFRFTRDIVGIGRHSDSRTGGLTGLFSPLCSAPKSLAI